MDRRRAVKSRGTSRALVVILVTVLLIAAIAGIVETGFFTRKQNTSTSSEITQTTLSTQPFDSPQFLTSSYLAFNLGYPDNPTSVGIASYGIFNYSGSLRSYSINTTEVVGEANVSALSASTNWNYVTAPSLNSLACVQCASLQMNVNIVARTPQGNQIFWVQNVVPFSNTTTHKIVDFYGLIFNVTTMNANVTTASSGNGRHGELQGKTTYAFGSFLGNMSDYSLPLHLKLATSASVYDGGIEVRMSDDPFGNGTFAADNDTFGVVDIPITNVTSASIVVMPSLYPWQGYDGLYRTYNSNLVWAAYCCGQTTMFTEMNSTLSLQYLDSNNQLKLYPSFYTFGFTGESATNLKVTPYHGGGQVMIGENNNSYLGN